MTLSIKWYERISVDERIIVVRALHQYEEIIQERLREAPAGRLGFSDKTRLTDRLNQIRALLSDLGEPTNNKDKKT